MFEQVYIAVTITFLLETYIYKENENWTKEPTIRPRATCILAISEKWTVWGEGARLTLRSVLY